MTGTDKKIIIDGKVVFLLFLAVLLVIIPTSFAEINTNNAEHILTEILGTNNLSVDFDGNDWVDEVDYTHEVDFLGVISDFTCPDGVMLGIDEDGPICFTLNKYYKEFNADKKCHSETKSCKNKCTLECNVKTEEMTFGVQRKGCPSEAYIVCCEASLPKQYDENYTEPGDCIDSDRDAGEPSEQSFIKGNVTLTETDTTKEDYCANEVRVKEFYCEDKKMKNEFFTCENGCKNGACIK